MSRTSSGPRSHPSGAKAITSFTVGILLGVVLVSPVLPTTIDLLYSGGGSFGTVGKAVMSMALLLLLVMFGFVTMFKIFVLIDW